MVDDARSVRTGQMVQINDEIRAATSQVERSRLQMVLMDFVLEGQSVPIAVNQTADFWEHGAPTKLAKKKAKK